MESKMTTSFQTEFPDYPIADMPEMPAHGDFFDTSWHNDACPSITSETLGLHIWIDFSDKSVREFEGGARFIVVRQEHGVDTGHTVIETDDWNEIIAVIEQERSK
jgi:hypothetical protein